MKKKLLAILATSVFLMSTPVHAIGTGWKVEDDGAHRMLSQIKSLLEVQHERDSRVAGWEQRNSVTSTINSTSVDVMRDLKKVELAAAPNLQKCIAVSSSAGSASTLNTSIQMANTLREQLAIKQNSIGNTNLLSNANMDGKQELCSITDVNNGLCKQAGKLAGWSDKYDSILQNPNTKTSTLTDKEIAYGADYVNSFTYALAPNPEDAGKGGNLLSEQAAALRKVWQQRMSPTVYALNQQLANSRAMPKSGVMTNMWDSPESKTAFAEIYGNAVRPETPSPRTLNSLLVMKPFTSTQITKRESTPNEVEAIRRVEEALAIQNYINMQILTQLETMNAQLGSLNAQALSPVSNDNSKVAGLGK